MVASQLIGLLLIINSIVICGWLVLSAKTPFTPTISITLLAIFAGGFLFLSERVTEFTVKGAGTIKAAANRASADADEVAKIRARVEAQSATVDLVAKNATEAKQISEEIKKQTNLAEEKLNELQAYTVFNSTVLAAQGDNREAFDSLKKWLEDKKFPFQKSAQQAFQAILDAHASPIVIGVGNVPWKEGFNDKTLTLEQVIREHQNVPDFIRPTFIEYIWKREDFKKNEKLEYFYHCLKETKSLKEVEAIGRIFASESKLKIKPLAYWIFMDWWEKNRDSYKAEPIRPVNPPETDG